MYWVWAIQKKKKNVLIWPRLKTGAKNVQNFIVFVVWRESKISFWDFLTFNAKRKKPSKKKEVTVCKDTKN